MKKDIKAPAQEESIKQLVDAFLAWPLPESVCSDQCATMRGYPHRTGTNLLTAVEAREMFKHCLAACGTPETQNMNNYRVFVVLPSGKRVEQRGEFVYEEDVEAFINDKRRFMLAGEKLEVCPRIPQMTRKAQV